MKRTTAPGSSSGAYVDDNPALGIVGTLLVASDRNIQQEEICAPIEGIGLTLDGSGADTAQLWKAMRRAIAERSKQVGEVFSLIDYKAPVSWAADGSAADTYFPALFLSFIGTYQDISAANWPDLVPFLRSVKTAGMDLTVTNWAVAANVVTLTFQNDGTHIAILTALAEDQAMHGSFSNWRSITIPTTFGNVVAGDYAITGINAASRTITFALTAANGSGAGTWTAQQYAFRIPGSTTTARVWTANGLALHGSFDTNSYFISGAVRSRGYMQGHYHDWSVFKTGSAAGAWTATGGNATMTLDNTAVIVGAPRTDGTNGTPRTRKETSSPALPVHLYIHGRRYLP